MKKIKQWFMGLSVKQRIVAIAIAFVVIVAIGSLNSDDASKVEPMPHHHMRHIVVLIALEDVDQ